MEALPFLGITSSLTGSESGSTVVINRYDTAPPSQVGFEGVFNGTVSSDGNSMSGTGANDPNSHNGNDGMYDWTAEQQ
jgi:hypothetical protein